MLSVFCNVYFNIRIFISNPFTPLQTGTQAPKSSYTCNVKQSGGQTGAVQLPTCKCTYTWGTNELIKSWARSCLWSQFIHAKRDYEWVTAPRVLELAQNALRPEGFHWRPTEDCRTGLRNLWSPGNTSAERGEEWWPRRRPTKVESIKGYYGMYGQGGVQELYCPECFVHIMSKWRQKLCSSK